MTRKHIFSFLILNNIISILLFIAFQFYMPISYNSEAVSYDTGNVLGEATFSKSTITQSNGIEISSEVKDVVHLADEGSYTLTYVYTITNPTQYNIRNVTATTNLAETFSGYPFEILGFSNNGLLKNNGFNGGSDTNLIMPGQTMIPGSTTTLTLNLKFIPGQDEGPFENYVDVNGDIEGPTDANQGQEEENNQSNGEIPEDDQNNTPNNPDSNSEPSEEETSNADNSSDDSDGDGYPDWWWNYETNLEPREIILYLVNAQNNRVLFEITEGMVIDITQLPTDSVRIRAEISPFADGSVKFEMNPSTDPLVRVENQYTFDFAFEGEDGNFDWDYTNGQHTLSVTAYTHKGANGQIIGSNTINFTIVNAEEEVSEETDSVTLTQTADSSNTFFNIVQNTSTDTNTTEGNQNNLKKPTVIVEGLPQKDIAPKPEVIENTISSGQNEAESNSPKVLGVSANLADTGVKLVSSTIIGFALVLIVFELNLLSKQYNYIKSLLKK